MLKRFFPYYRPYKGIFALDLAAALALAGIDLAFPVATRTVIDSIVPEGNWRLLWLFVIALAALYLARAGLEWIVGYVGHELGVNIQRDMRRDIFAHLQRLDARFYDDTKTGQVMSRVVSDLFEIAEVSHHLPEDLLVASVRLLGTVAVMATIEWRLALLVMLVIPFELALALRFRHGFKRVFKLSKETIAAVNERIEENVSGSRVVRAFGREDYERGLFDEGNERFRDARLATVRQFVSFNMLTGLLSNFGLVLVLGAGGWAAIKGDISAGGFAAFALFVTRFFHPLETLVRSVEMFQDGAAGFRRFLEIMDRKPSVADAPDAVELRAVKGAVEFRDVGFRYSDERDRVLHRVSLKVEPGRTVAIVGPSGAGKSTLCSLIPRFYEIEEGSISIDGVDIRKATLASLRAAVGIVQQDVFLFSGTIRDNVLYGKLDATEAELREALRAANALEFVEGFPDGLDTVIGERGVKLSGGQKQRVAIARMFLRNPPVLILDEATSSLDAASEAAIRDSLERLSKGRTTFVIAHRLATIRRAERILVLTEDGIVEEGSHAELMERDGHYRELFEIQMDGLLAG